MSDFLSGLYLLAQEAPPEAAPAEPTPFWLILLPFLAIILLFQLMFSPRRQEQRRREQLLKTLKKNDRVVTIGGIIGTVANIAPEKNEVTIKVDENTRLRMRIYSIQDVIRDEDDKGEAR